MPTKKNFLGGQQNYDPKNGEYEPSLVGKNGKVVKDADGDGKTHEGWDFDEESKIYTSKDGEVFSEKDYQKKIGGEQLREKPEPTPFTDEPSVEKKTKEPSIQDAIDKANASNSKMNVTSPKANVSTSSSGGAIQDILSKYQEEASKIDPSDERALNRLKGKYEGRYEKELEAAGITDIDQLESKYHKTNEGYIDLDETGWNAKKETLKESLKDLYRESDIDDVIKMREEGYKAAQKYYGGKVPESVKGGIKEYLEKTNPGEYQTDYIKTDATVDDFAKAWNSGSFDSILIDEGGLDSDPRNVILEYVESQGYKYDSKTGDLIKTSPRAKRSAVDVFDIAIKAIKDNYKHIPGGTGINHIKDVLIAYTDLSKEEIKDFMSKHGSIKILKEFGAIEPAKKNK